MGLHVLVTGAEGFVGRALARRIVKERAVAGQRVDRLSLLDLGFSPGPADEPWVRRLSGDLFDGHWLASAFGDVPVDVVFHLASVPGGTAENQHALARRVNVDATVSLLELARCQSEASATPPRFVFASSIAVFGSLHPMATEDVEPQPQMTYGAHKLIGEVLVQDYSRRRWVDGFSLRMAGVLARPPARTGQLSAFLSDIIRELAAGRPFVCPMSAQTRTWASSVGNVVDNLLHAASLAGVLTTERRTFTLPMTRFSMSELVAAIGSIAAADLHPLVRYQPVEQIERLFGGLPEMRTPRAEAAGFERDLDLQTLVRRALEGAAEAESSAAADVPG